MTYNHTHTIWIWRTSLACNEAGLQTIHGFSRMQNFGSRRAFILRLPLFLLFPSFIEMPQTYKTLNLSNSTLMLLFLNFLSLFFILVFFYLLLLYIIFLCGCYLSYHNYHHPISSPKFGTNLLWTMMLSYNLKKGRWRL